ncbi:hypothetical protein HK101_005576 [Irineochytrium annulatum]|nr:hypothetical protein HK101_005576 [Irineochytrium annulatum]
MIRAVQQQHINHAKENTPIARAKNGASTKTPFGGVGAATGVKPMAARLAAKEKPGTLFKATFLRDITNETPIRGNGVGPLVASQKPTVGTAKPTAVAATAAGKTNVRKPTVTSASKKATTTPPNPTKSTKSRQPLKEVQVQPLEEPRKVEPAEDVPEVKIRPKSTGKKSSTGSRSSLSAKSMSANSRLKTQQPAAEAAIAASSVLLEEEDEDEGPIEYVPPPVEPLPSLAFGDYPNFNYDAFRDAMRAIPVDYALVERAKQSLIRDESDFMLDEVIFTQPGTFSRRMRKLTKKQITFRRISSASLSICPNFR